MNARDIIYESLLHGPCETRAALNNLISNLTKNGYAIVPVELPHEVLGEATINGVSDTDNPKHCWDYLVAKIRVY